MRDVYSCHAWPYSHVFNDSDVQGRSTVATKAPSCVLRRSTALCSMSQIEDDAYVLNIIAVPKGKRREDGERWL